MLHGEGAQFKNLALASIHCSDLKIHANVRNQKKGHATLNTGPEQAALAVTPQKGNPAAVPANPTQNRTNRR